MPPNSSPAPEVLAALRELLARAVRGVPLDLPATEAALGDPRRTDALGELLALALAAEHAPAHPALPGHAFGPFLVGAELGAQDGGTTHRAERLWPRTAVFLHVVALPAEVPPEDPARRRFELEVDALASPVHPAVDPLLDAGYLGRWRFTATAEPTGTPLPAWLARERGSAGGLEPDRVLGIATALAQALEALHRAGVTHRALHPGHVQILADDRPQLGGLARVAPREPLPRDHPGAHRAPEHFRDEPGGRDHRTDLFQLGLLFFELLDGRPALRGPRTTLERRARRAVVPPPRRRNDDVSRGLEAIARRLLARHPRDRYATAKELRLDLEHLSRGRSPQAPAVGFAGRTWARVRSLAAGGPWG